MSFSAAAGKIAPTVIHTDAAGLAHGDFQLPWMTAPSPPTMPRPPAGRTCPSCWWCRRSLACTSTSGSVPSPGARRLPGGGRQPVRASGRCIHHTDIPKLVAELVSKVSDEQVYADLDASLAWAARNGGDPARVAVTGLLGRPPDLDVCRAQPGREGRVAWYGKLSVGHGRSSSATRWTAQDLRAPVLGLYGGRDASIPLADVDRMKASLAAGRCGAPLRDRGLPRGRPRLPGRLSSQLQRPGRPGRLAPHAGLVPEPPLIARWQERP